MNDALPDIELPGMSRRRFAGLTALAALGLVLGCTPDKEDMPEEVPAVVIGSGFGGAVAALRLGRAGIKTIVIERGKSWPITPAYNTFSSTFTPDGRSTWLRTRTVPPLEAGQFAIDSYTGVLERTDFDTIQVYSGAGVGGGSLVYGGMTVQPEKYLFEQVFPPEISYAELAAVYYPRVRAMLDARPVPADVWNWDEYTAARIARQHSEAIGVPVVQIDQAYDWNLIREEKNGQRPRSALNGDLLYGNNSGAKNSLDHNYIPAALATGNVTIHELHQVTRISMSAAGKYVLNIAQLDTQGNVVSTKTLLCKHLFLAAGSLRTTELLLGAKHRGDLPNLHESLGEGWGTNGNSMFMRGGLTEATGMMQASPPVIAQQDFANPVAPALVEQANFPIGTDCNCLMYLACPVVPDRGRLAWNAATESVYPEWPSTGNDTAANAAASFAERLNAANGGQISTEFVDGPTKTFTYHPLGGAVIGQTTDWYGRVKNYTNLYVVDGSLIPGSTACANPSLTIAAIAERNMEYILAHNFEA